MLSDRCSTPIPVCRNSEPNHRLAAPPTDRDFELWAISGSNAPVSMDVVKAASRKDIALSPGLKAQFGEGTVLAITVEPTGGSPTGAPTGSIVAQGIATRI